MKTAILNKATVKQAVKDLKANDYIVKDDEGNFVVTDFDNNEVFRALKMNATGAKYMVRYDTKVMS